eukprot:jgi/Chlat1/3109/Chrsp21S03391
MGGGCSVAAAAAGGDDDNAAASGDGVAASVKPQPGLPGHTGRVLCMAAAPAAPATGGGSTKQQPQRLYTGGDDGRVYDVDADPHVYSGSHDGEVRAWVPNKAGGGGGASAPTTPRGGNAQHVGFRDNNNNNGSVPPTPRGGGGWGGGGEGSAASTPRGGGGGEGGMWGDVVPPSPRGRKAVFAGHKDADRTVREWDRASARTLRVFPATDSLAANDPGCVRGWDLSPLDPTSTPKPSPKSSQLHPSLSPVSAFALAFERAFLAGGGAPVEHSLATLKRVRELHGHIDAVRCLAVVGDMLYSGAGEGELREWSLASRAHTRSERVFRPYLEGGDGADFVQRIVDRLGG